ncbi:MAG TPA: alpha-amylase family glycosyl hydrolase, partial [Oculatellaceae cyanobacterium]
ALAGVKDNGYDVMDYYNVDSRLGTLGDFVEFARQAHERGIRIIVDLVINHTSDQHPWFQEWATLSRHLRLLGSS